MQSLPRFFLRTEIHVHVRKAILVSCDLWHWHLAVGWYFRHGQCYCVIQTWEHRFECHQAMQVFDVDLANSFSFTMNGQWTMMKSSCNDSTTWLWMAYESSSKIWPSDLHRHRCSETLVLRLNVRTSHADQLHPHCTRQPFFISQVWLLNFTIPHPYTAEQLD